MAGVADIRVLVAWRDHAKRVRLERRLGAAGVLALLDLWLYAGASRPGGDLVGMTEEDIEIAAQWRGHPGALVATLIDLRLLDREADGGLILHDWPDHQGWATGAARRSEAARQAGIASAAARTRQRPLTSQPTAVDLAANGRSTDVAKLATPSPSPSPSPKDFAAAEPPRTAGAGLILTPPEPAGGLPFTIAAAVAALSSTAGARWNAAAKVARKLHPPLGALIKAHRDLDEFRVLGRYLAAGYGWSTDPRGPSWLASTAGAECMAAAQTWHERGEPASSSAIGPRQPPGPAAPAPPRLKSVAEYRPK